MEASSRTRIPALLAAVLAVAALPGCFRLELAVTLRADGTGEQRLTVRVDEAVLDRARRAAQVLGDADGERPDPTRLFDRDAVAREVRAAGLEILDHEVDQDGARRSTQLRVAFADRDALAKSPLSGPTAEWFVLPGRNPGGVRVVFYPQGHRAWQQARERVVQLGDQPDDVRHAFFAGQRERLAGLDVSFELHLPGAIDYASPGVELVDADTVRLRYRAADFESAEDVVRALAPRLEVEFDGSEVDWEFDAADPGPAAAPAPSRR